MADIINSRNQDSARLLVDFKNIVNYINKKWSAETLSPLTITLGDEFQGVISSSSVVFSIIFDIEEEIVKSNLNLKLRYVYNIGTIDTEINHNIAYGMLGAGLTNAREKLNEMKISKKRFQIVTNNNLQAQGIINDLFKIYGNYVDGWKKSDYYIVKEFLLNKNYQEVAEVLKVNTSSSWRRQKSLNIEEYIICKQLILKLNSILYV